MLVLYTAIFKDTSVTSRENALMIYMILSQTRTKDLQRHEHRVRYIYIYQQASLNLKKKIE